MKKITKSLLLTSTLVGGSYYLYSKKKEKFLFYSSSKEQKATAFLNGQFGVSGKVNFRQFSDNSETIIEGRITGLKPGLHGFHIHEFGDISGGCDSAGPHYNPHGVSHGGPNELVRHLGDLGNIEANKDGIAEFKFEEKVSLYGEYSVIGRTLVVHRDEDDLGKGGHELSKTTGNSGPRLACGVIGISK